MGVKITKETAKEYQARSVEARNKNTAERKAFKEYIDELLNEIVSDADGKPATRKKLLAIKWLNYVTEDTADIEEGKAFTQIVKEIRDTIGEKPIDKMQHTFDATNEAYADYVREKEDSGGADI